MCAPMLLGCEQVALTKIYKRIARALLCLGTKDRLAEARGILVKVDKRLHVVDCTAVISQVYAERPGASSSR